MPIIKEKHKPNLTKGSGSFDPDRINYLQNEWLVSFITRNNFGLNNKRIIIQKA